MGANLRAPRESWSPRLAGTVKTVTLRMDETDPPLTE